GDSPQEVSSYLTKALQRYAAANALDPELRDLTREFAASLRSSYDKKVKSLGTVVEKLCENAGAVPEKRSVIVRNPPKPSFAGCLPVLYDLKCLVGMAQAEPDQPRLQVGPDRFQMPAASPLVNEHEKLTEVLNEAVGSRNYHSPDLRALPTGRMILDFDP